MSRVDKLDPFTYEGFVLDYVFISNRSNQIVLTKNKLVKLVDGSEIWIIFFNLNWVCVIYFSDA